MEASLTQHLLHEGVEEVTQTEILFGGKERDHLLIHKPPS